MTQFNAFAQVAEQIRATSKRLEKTRLLVEHWRPLPDDDLLLSARYFAGQVFALWDQRVLRVGHAALLKALSALSQQPIGALKQRLVQLGDLGDLAGEVLPPRAAAELTLQALHTAFTALLEHSKPAARSVAVQALLARCAPLQGKYVVKLMLGDLRIGLKEGTVEDAIARAYGSDVGTVQWANMLLGDAGETAVRARQGDLHTVHMRLFHPLKFMLSTPALDLAAVQQQFTDSYAVEDKYDGIRAQAHVGRDPGTSAHGVLHQGRRVALFSRTLDDITQSFPDLIAPLAALGSQGDVVLDGEILAMQGDQVLPFAALQKRLGRKSPDAALQEATPVALVLFDLLVLGDRILLPEPFTTRRALLEGLPLPLGQRIRVTPSAIMRGTDGLDAAFLAARQRGHEGLMLKALNATYKPGRRGREWLKLKRSQANLDVVITAAEVGHGKRHQVLSDYTFAVRKSATDATLVDIGKAYSGLTDREIAALTRRLVQETTAIINHGKKRLVRPTIVLEVTFDLIQPSNRYTSGYALRFPRIVRLRDDKPVSEIDTLETVASLCSRSAFGAVFIRQL